MNDLVIVGHGGLAKEVAFLVEEINRQQPAWRLLGFITDRPDCVGQRQGDYPIMDTDEGLLRRTQDCAVAVAIGQPAALRVVHERLRPNPRLSFPNLIHPDVSGDWARIQLGAGNIALNGATFTTAIRLGSFNQFNPGATVSHDCVLGSYNLVSPGANLCGAVALEDEVFVGAGAVVMQGLRVARGAVIGAGAVVVREITEAGTYVGVPARKL
ncbi:MAG: NeuD/PglB/VioB family sugar acetyltransferase [Verrucomicrobia bacterium]|jgi:sugar O-acyltransferase (sialic acid O-acetyltransferase NeuD family)|nr:NeuD/PglB/VioB family sugar acetyltransferase [Verrucomicrobiota bacterium]